MKMKKEITKTISYKLKFFVRFMASSLSNLVNDLAKGIHKIKYKYEHDNKKCCCNLAELNTKIVSVFLNTKTLNTTS